MSQQNQSGSPKRPKTPKISPLSSIPKSIDQGWATIVAAIIALIGVIIGLLITANNVPTNSSNAPSAIPSISNTAASYSTNTPSMTNTPRVSTPTVTREINIQPTPNSIIFLDDFSNNSGKWILSSGLVTDNLSYPTDMLKMHIYRIDRKLRWETTMYQGPRTIQNLPIIEKVSNFELEAEIRLVQGGAKDSFGVTFRNGDRGLYNLLLRDGKYQLSLIDDIGGRRNDRVIIPLYSEQTPEKYWREENSIKAHEWNKVRIRALNSTITIFINDLENPVVEIDDFYLLSGNVGLIANIDSNSTLITESRYFKVTNLN